MPSTRRNFIQKSLALIAYFSSASSTLIYSTLAKATSWPVEKFIESEYSIALKKIIGDQNLLETDKINLKLPRIAENGAVVPLTITSSLGNIETFSILVEKNPIPLVAQFNLTETSEAYISARIKMAETSDVIIIAKADEQFYSSKQRVKVTIGGCGG